MKSFKVRTDDTRETAKALGVPIGAHGDYPIRYHAWLPLSQCKIADYGTYYHVGVPEWVLKDKINDGDDIITYIPL